jgi:hypothetical protein
MFASISEHFANIRHVKGAKLVFRARMHYFRVPKLWSIHSSPLGPKWCLWVFQMISLSFGTNKVQNFCSSLNALFRGTKVVKHPFKSIRPNMMYGSVSEHFANPWQVKDKILVFRARMQYFGVPKLWSIHSSTLDPKWCLEVFRSISQTLGR